MTDRDNRGRALRERLGSTGDDASENAPSEASEAAGTAKKERMGGREETEGMAETSKREGTSESAERTETDAGDPDGSVKERRNVNMYLPEELVDELQIRFDELNARHRREHGEPMEKNREYYPAVTATGIESEALEERLDLE